MEADAQEALPMDSFIAGNGAMHLGHMGTRKTTQRKWQRVRQKMRLIKGSPCQSEGRYPVTQRADTSQLRCFKQMMVSTMTIQERGP